MRPTDAFAQGINRLMPSLDFNTFDKKKAKARRVVTRQRQEKVADDRRKKRMAPTLAMRAAPDAHVIPKEKKIVDGEEAQIMELLTKKAGRKGRRRTAKKPHERPIATTGHSL